MEGAAPGVRTLDEAKPPSRPDVDVDVVDDLGEDEDPERVIRCAECGHPITRQKHRFAMDGRHDHVFTNPHGYVFHIACFREADGAGGVGEESDEWAWFAGWVWQTAICRGCMTHLGWLFRQGERLFWGLIVGKLEE